MKKAKLSVLLGSMFIMLVFILGPALSTPMTSSSYSIPSLTISSGGHIGLQSTSYKLQDIKGQAVIGAGSSASFGLGLGGVYGTLGVEGLVEGLGVGDTGLIRNTRIVRENDGNPSTPDRILLYWEYAAGSGLTRADIWEFRGADAAFNSNASTGWIKPSSSPFTGTSADTGRFSSDGQNSYYRIVPAGTAQINIMDLALNTRVAGKIDIRFPGGGIANYKLMSVPLYGNSMNSVFAGQATSNMILWPQSGSGVTAREWTTSTPLRTDIEIRPGVGYWVQNDGLAGTGDITISFVGTPETRNYRNITSPRDLTGNPLPIVANSSTLGGFYDSAREEGDKIWTQSGSGVTVKEFRSLAPGLPMRWPSFSLGIHEGFWYWPVGDRHFFINLFDSEGAKIREGLSP